MGNKKKKACNGAKKYAFGLENAIGVAGYAAPIIGQVGGDDAGSFLGEAVGGASTGMAIGSALGPMGAGIGAAAGGLLGGVKNLFSSGSRRRAARRAEQKRKANNQRMLDSKSFEHQMARSEEMAMAYEEDNPIIPTFQFGTEGKSMVNHNEIVQFPNGKSKRVVDNSGLVDNVAINLPDNSSVFSDDIFMPDGKSVAHHAAKQTKILDKKYTSGSKFSRQSKELNDSNAKKRLEELKLYQKQYRESNNIPTGGKFKYGTENPGLGRMISRAKTSRVPVLNPNFANMPENLIFDPSNPTKFVGDMLNVPLSTTNTTQPKASESFPVAPKRAQIPMFVQSGQQITTPTSTQAIESPVSVVASKPTTVKTPRKSPTVAAPTSRNIPQSLSQEDIDNTFRVDGISAPSITANTIIPTGARNIKQSITSGLGKDKGEDKKVDIPGILSSSQEFLADYMSLAPYRFNSKMGNREEDLVTPEYNPFSSTITNALRARRISDTASMEANRRGKSIQRHNARNITGSGQSAAYGLASDVMMDRQLQDILQQNQQINNSYVSEYANALMGLGNTMASANAEARDINARNKAATNAFKGAAATNLADFYQNKAAMSGKKSTNAAKLEAIRPLLEEALPKEKLEDLYKILGRHGK